jgi:hypothetical protein
MGWACMHSGVSGGLHLKYTHIISSVSKATKVGHHQGQGCLVSPDPTSAHAERGSGVQAFGTVRGMA